MTAASQATPSRQHPQKYLGAKGLIILIALLSAFVPLSTDLYLPALPGMGDAFQVSAEKINLTLTLFFIFYSLGTLLWGPFSDRFGRKPVLLLGLTVYLLASGFCAVAWNVEVLILARILQAAGGSAATLDGIALGLPALTRAAKLGRRAAGVGFDWSRAADVLAKVDEECTELRGALDEGRAAAVEEELGDLLFSLAQFARHAGIDPETALRAANAKFERRFRRMESWLAEQGRLPRDATPDELESLWAKAKQESG